MGAALRRGEGGGRLVGPRMGCRTQVATESDQELDRTETDFDFVSCCDDNVLSRRLLSSQLDLPIEYESKCQKWQAAHNEICDA